LLSRPGHGGKRKDPKGCVALPSLIRFLAILGVLAAVAWGGMLALVTFVEPQQREMTQAVPAQKLTGK
jgi:hypothetical protein